MVKVDENYVERLCNSVAKKMVEVIESITIEDVNAYKVGYNKAIDEFMRLVVAEYDNDCCPCVSDYLDYRLSIRELFEIAEQMKGE